MPNRSYKQDIAPRLLFKKQAAAYCGMAVESFNRLVDVPPIDLTERDGSGRPMLRYDIEDLDKWIENKKHTQPKTLNDILDKLGT